MEKDLIIDFNELDHLANLYWDNIKLYHLNKNSCENSLLTAIKTNAEKIGKLCIYKNILTEEDLELDLLPRVCIPTLLGNISNIGGDGDE